MQTLFEAVRSACSSASWSRGVELVRRGGVTRGRSDADDVLVRVTTGRDPVAPEVHLYPSELEWECDCGSAEDPCDHVAAAVIALRRAPEAGPTGSEGASRRIGYRLVRAGRRLELVRVVCVAGEETVLESSLQALAARGGPPLVAGRPDQRLEELLGPRPSRSIPRAMASRLIGLLVACDDVRLDGVPVELSSEPVLPRAILEDHGDGFQLTLRRDPQLEEVFSNGIARCAGVLRPLADVSLSQRERDELLTGRFYSASEAGDLVSEVLPSLASRVPLEVRTQRLPRTRRVRPRCRVRVQREGDALCVVPELVYGDPELARVEDGKLVSRGAEVPLRDEAAEARLRAQLRHEVGLTPGVPLRIEASEAIELATRLARFSGEVVGSDHEQFFLVGELAPRLEAEVANFDVEFETQVGQVRARVAGAEVLRAWRAGQTLVPLLGGGFAPLPRDWLGRFGGLVADLLAARDSQDRLPTCVLPDLAELCDGLGEPRPPALDRLLAAFEDGPGEAPVVLPADLRAELRPYQREGVRWLSRLGGAGLGGVLADDMGLGKTLQALCAYRGRTLVVCPTSVLHGWVDQLRRFRPGVRFALYHGPSRALDPEAEITLTTYSLMRSDRELLASQDWETLILDEAQFIKNPHSQVAHAAHALPGAFRITLTGTPIENRLDDLWSQLHFTNPGLLGSLAHFRGAYVRPIEAGDDDALQRLRARIRPFLLRRLKSEVAAELPPRTDAVLHCELSPAERAAYEGVRLATRREVVARLGAGGGVMQALELLLRLRQAACHTGLLPGQQAVTSSKLEVLLAALEEALAEGHKALVFSQWTGLLDLLEPKLAARGLPALRLDGGTRDRGAVIDRFQDPAGPPLLLISLRAGGTGLNLTAADHVFLLDPWWNPAVEDQAADRVHRIGQERPVFVYRLVARETVEERILELQERKRGLVSAALSGVGGAGSLTREDLLALLE